MSVGVIVAVHQDAVAWDSARVRDELERIFPGVTFAIVAGAMTSLAFEFHEPTKQAPPIPSKSLTGPR